MRKGSGRVIILSIVFILIIISTLNCLLANPVSNKSTQNEMTESKVDEVPKQTQETLGDQSASDKIYQDTFGNKINYSNPKLYLASGTQSNLSEKHFNEINKQLVIENNDINKIGEIFTWKQNYFQANAAGGKSIGKTTVNQLMEEKILTGCHDHGLFLVSVFRKWGFPSIMVDAAGIQWALDYVEGEQTGFKGHVFIEVYVNEEWILINSTSGKYFKDYEPLNPIIPMSDSAESKGYFALFKGLDPAGYGIKSKEQLTKNMELFASEFNVTKVSFPKYKINMLP